MKEFGEKIVDFLYRWGEKLDNFSDKIYDQVHVRINFKAILGTILGVIIVFFVVKNVLGFLWSKLNS